MNRGLAECSILFKFKEGEILNTGIYWIFRGLKFEPDAKIGQKGTLCKGLE